MVPTSHDPQFSIHKNHIHKPTTLQRTTHTHTDCTANHTHTSHDHIRTQTTRHPSHSIQYTNHTHTLTFFKSIGFFMIW